MIEQNANKHSFFILSHRGMCWRSLRTSQDILLNEQRWSKHSVANEQTRRKCDLIGTSGALIDMHRWEEMYTSLVFQRKLVISKSMSKLASKCAPDITILFSLHMETICNAKHELIRVISCQKSIAYCSISLKFVPNSSISQWKVCNGMWTTERKVTLQKWKWSWKKCRHPVKSYMWRVIGLPH